MTNVSVKLNGVSANATASGKLTSGMVGIPVTFEYDSSWDGLNKTACFRVGRFSRKRENVETSTTVPWEVMRHSGKPLEIGVEGRDANGDIVMPTVWAIVSVIYEGADAEIPAAPNPDDDENTGAIIESNAVLYTPQNLTPEEKAQARENIGAVGGIQGVENAETLLYVGADGNVTNVEIGDGIEVRQGIGKNIVHGEWEHGQYTATGAWIISTVAACSINKKFPVTPGGTYTASVIALGNATWMNLYVYEFDENGDFVIENTQAKGGLSPTSPRTFTVSETTAYIGFHLYSTGVSWEDVIPEGMMIEPGSVATEYEPFSPGNYILSVKEQDSITDMAYAEHAPSATVRSIAHRGAPGNAPECTAHAYILAKKLGFTVAENDVQRTSDGKYVMWHDPTFKYGKAVYSLDGKVLVADANGNYYWFGGSAAYTYDEATETYTAADVSISTLTAVAGQNVTVAEQTYAFLRNIDVGRWKDDKFIGTQMLSFEEWIDLCKSLGMECYVDAKFTYTDEQAAELVSIVRRKGMLRKCSWLSCMASVRKADPDARCGILWAPTADSLGSGGNENTFWNPPASDVTAENVAMALDAGYGYECWYVGTANVGDATYYAEIERLLQCGVQGLTLDDHTVEDFTAYKYREAMLQY